VSRRDRYREHLGRIDLGGDHPLMVVVPRDTARDLLNVAEAARTYAQARARFDQERAVKGRILEARTVYDKASYDLDAALAVLDGEGQS
jgi:hypothetical protein